VADNLNSCEDVCAENGHVHLRGDCLPSHACGSIHYLQEEAGQLAEEVSLIAFGMKWRLSLGEAVEY